MTQKEQTLYTMFLDGIFFPFELIEIGIRKLKDKRERRKVLRRSRWKK